MLAALVLARAGKTLLAFVCSAVSVAAVIGTFAVSMFPFTPAQQQRFSLEPDGVGCHFEPPYVNRDVFFFAIILIMPVVVAYTGWAFNVMRGKVTAEYVRENDHSAY